VFGGLVGTWYPYPRAEGVLETGNWKSKPQAPSPENGKPARRPYLSLITSCASNNGRATATRHTSRLAGTVLPPPLGVAAPCTYSTRAGDPELIENQRTAGTRGGAAASAGRETARCTTHPVTNSSPHRLQTPARAGVQAVRAPVSAASSPGGLDSPKGRVQGGRAVLQIGSFGAPEANQAF
jgi:hypothetical protein